MYANILQLEYVLRYALCPIIGCMVIGWLQSRALSWEGFYTSDTSLCKWWLHENIMMLQWYSGLRRHFWKQRLHEHNGVCYSSVCMYVIHVTRPVICSLIECGHTMDTIIIIILGAALIL